MRLFALLRSVLVYMFVEGFGYSRRSPVSEWDLQQREEANNRVARLEEEMLALRDEHVDLLTRYGRRRTDRR